MINQVYRLVSPRQFDIVNIEKTITDGQIIVKPTYMAICHADQRYFNGNRDKKVLRKKLPMALIHEAVGKVVYDQTGEYGVGTNVVLIPNTPTVIDEVIGENYLPASRFRSSGYDGFMQDYVFMDKDRVVRIPENVDLKVAAFSELTSVAMHAISRFKSRSHKNKGAIGVWGDGNLGYLVCLLLKRIYPETKVMLFGKNQSKLDYFSFVDEAYQIDDIPPNIILDHAFECVGGNGSKHAIDQIIDHIQPEGTISLLGVSEDPVEVNTRMVLEKGLVLYGSSRSGRQDFQETMDVISQDVEIQNYLGNLIGDFYEVNNIDDILKAFESDMTRSWGKTVMHWKI
ncbi:MAG: ribitol-5-phosphate dehydrogenase [Turicibacter sp.]|nr:ribitol-5-phosphate dehydrogenase [Turicibacter sp.]